MYTYIRTPVWEILIINTYMVMIITVSNIPMEIVVVCCSSGEYVLSLVLCMHHIFTVYYLRVIRRKENGNLNKGLRRLYNTI